MMQAQPPTGASGRPRAESPAVSRQQRRARRRRARRLRAQRGAPPMLWAVRSDEPRRPSAKRLRMQQTEFGPRVAARRVRGRVPANPYALLWAKSGGAGSLGRSLRKTAASAWSCRGRYRGCDCSFHAGERCREPTDGRDCRCREGPRRRGVEGNEAARRRSGLERIGGSRKARPHCGSGGRGGTQHRV